MLGIEPQPTAYKATTLSAVPTILLTVDLKTLEKWVVMVFVLL